MEITIFTFGGPSRNFSVNHYMKILVIEDDNIVGAYIQHKLEFLREKFSDLEVEWVTSLADADKIIPVFKPDVITLDLTLQNDERADFVTGQIPRLSKIAPLAVVSGSESERETCLIAGAAIFINKKDITRQTFFDQILSICYRVKHHLT